jgi:hypothetical protein
MHQRYYTATAGRFYTPDPKGLAAVDLQNPASWNMYAYVNDDPINFKDPRGTDAVAADDEGPPDPGWSPVINPGRPPRDDDSNPYSECNKGGNPSNQKKLDFISANGADAEKAAVGVQFALGSVNINTDHLAATFLAWSMNESGYGQSKQFLLTNNYFGNNARSSDYSVSCPAGAQPGAACYSYNFSFGDQLTLALSTVPHTKNDPNPNNLSYGQFLESALSVNPNQTTEQIMNVIGQAGWNPNPNYGSNIAAIANVGRLFDCAKANGYF